MANLSDSNVEFFQSQSSFGSSSVLSNSRANNLADELIDQSETIFHSLRQSLVPRQDLVTWKEVKHIIHRARILCRQTIPENLVYLQRDPLIRDEKIRQIKIQSQKLTELLNNFEAYEADHINYQAFYEKYGMNKKPDFTKRPTANLQLQTDVVEIIDNSKSRYLRQRNNFPLATPRQNLIAREKQTQELYDEINRLKKRERELIKERQTYQTQIKMETEQRINNILKLYKDKDGKDILNHETAAIKSQLEKQILFNKKLNEQQQQLIHANRNLTEMNNTLQLELESTRRVANSRISENNQLHRSTISQQQPQGSQPRKLKKMIQNLKFEKNLLRSQLNKQRQRFYKQEKKEINASIEQNSHLKKQLQHKNEQIRKLNVKIDEYRVENIRLLQKIKEIEKIRSISQPEELVEEKKVKEPSQFEEEKSKSRMEEKFVVREYRGEGDEGYPYYELLNKEFKVRFRRACLRHKQLLYKGNGLQIGQISSFIDPNTIRLVIHISNFGDQEPIRDLQLKMTNSKNNRIMSSSQNSKFPVVEPGHQLKYPIEFIVKNYPIGTSILVCEYSYYGKNQEVRIVLPLHIFKMLSFKPRDCQFSEHPSRYVIPTQRKIGQNIKQLQQYFKGASIKQNSIECSLYHEHSQTKIILDLLQKQNSPDIQLTAELRSGQFHIFDYILKTLIFLLKKQR